MIESIQLGPELCRTYGLRPVRLSGLDEVVAIAGPNGAGKSRLLRLLAEQWAALSQIADRVLAYDGRKFSPRRSSRKASRQSQPPVAITEEEKHEAFNNQLGVLIQYFIESAKGSQGAPMVEGHSEWLAKISEEFQRELEGVRNTLTLRGGSEHVLRSGGWPSLVRIINDPRHEKSWRDRDEPVESLQLPSLQRLHRAARYSFMSEHRTWRSTHEDEVTAAGAFLDTVSELLGVECGWREDDRSEEILATFDGRPVVENELSGGQRVILRWCELIHDQVTDLRQAIILLDEPELHLHPDLLRRTIARLRALEPAQLWIATHSLPLLADLGVRNLYEMRDGTISWAGNRTLDVQRSLLGPDGADNLRTFLADAATVAFHQFAAECLLQPGVVPLRGKDPQAAQFTNHLSQLLVSTTDDIHVLDHAAGSGRLIEAVAALPSEARAHLRYHAFCDPEFTTPDQREACRTQLARLHPDTPDAFFHPDLRALQRTDATKMHAVVLSNVLHEIPPTEWPRLMDDIAACLAPDGWLLILEDQRINVGELPHDKGFLVLDKIELQELFGVSDREPGPLRFATIDDRLSLAQISRAVLRNCDGPHVQSALRLLAKRSLDHVRRLRRANPDPADHRRGRAHAYYAMLHTNATLALERQ